MYTERSSTTSCGCNCTLGCCEQYYWCWQLLLHLPETALLAEGGPRHPGCLEAAPQQSHYWEMGEEHNQFQAFMSEGTSHNHISNQCLTLPDQEKN